MTRIGDLMSYCVVERATQNARIYRALPCNEVLANDLLLRRFHTFVEAAKYASTLNNDVHL